MLVWYFCGTTNIEDGCTYDSFASSFDCLPPVCLPCPASIQGLLPRLIVSCCVLFDCHLLEACSFLKRKQKGNGSGGEGRLGGSEEIEGRKTVVRMHCMRAESIFSKKELKI